MTTKQPFGLIPGRSVTGGRDMVLDSITEEEVLLPIADVVKMLKLTYRTVRYYEDQDMVHPKRTGKGTASRRWYRPEDIKRLREIIRLRAAGFSLREIKEVIAINNRDSKKRKTITIAEVVRKRLSSDLETLMSHTRSLERLTQELS